MKTLILSFLVFVSSSVNAATFIFDKVIDADTIAYKIPELPKEIQSVKIRVYGIDSPESTAKAKCEKERLLGIEAKNFLKKYSKASNTTIEVISWDKYGGRIIAKVYVDGKPLAQTLIEKGYAREYYGDNKGKHWCS